MEHESAKKEKDDGEALDGSFTFVRNFSDQNSREGDDDCEPEDKVADFSSQETPYLATPEASENAEAMWEEDTEELPDMMEGSGFGEQDNRSFLNQEDDEAVKDQHMNGSSAWRNIGGGRRFKLKSGGSVLEQSSQSSFSPFQKVNIVTSGSRHKQARKRNYHHHQQNRGRRRTGNQLFLAFKEMLSESLSVWCVSCFHMFIEIIVTLTHNCGIGVETGAVKLYNVGQQLFAKMTDIPGMKEDLNHFWKWTKQFLANLTDKTLRGLKWVKAAGLFGFMVVYALSTVSFLWVKGVLARVGGERWKNLCAAFQESSFLKRVLSLMDRVRKKFWRGGRSPAFTPESPGKAGKFMQGQELERLLALAEVPEEELDPFIVLGVEIDATETELKKAYRQLAVQVHPDKNKHPRAGEAFKVLRAAWDIVSNPETRREYELKRMAATELSRSMNEFLTKLQDDLKEAMNTMMCTKCEGKHKRFEMDREPSEARFCAECSRCHSAEEGDLWAESSMLGLRITYFACMEGKVYDITEWAGCQRIVISPDTHRVPYHISFGSKNNSNATRHRMPSEHAQGPPNPADLQNFFNRIFKGGPPNDMPANGSFFPSGSPPPPPHHHHPPGAGAAPFPPPPGSTGFFMPGAHRSESADTFDSGKPPRRRKKVRKPFQR